MQNLVRYEAASRTPTVPADGRIAAAAPRLRNYLFRLALGLAVVLVVIFSAGGIALASREALPGDALYPVKRTVERAQLAFTFQADEKAALHIELAERRLLEVQALILENRFEQLDRAIRDYETQVELAVRSVNLVAARSPERAVDLATTLQEALSSETATLNTLAALVPPDFQEDFQRLILVSTAGIIVTDEIISSVPATPTPTERVGAAATRGASTSTNTPTATETPLATLVNTLILSLIHI